jgi:hypothetical protein
MSNRISSAYNTYSKMLNPAFREKVEGIIDQWEREFYESMPGAQDMLDPDKFSIDFYKRQTIETILRIGLKRAVDPLIANYWATRDPVLCKQWGLYGAEEGLHTQMFAKDLIKIGMTEEEIYGTQPTFATELLNGYFYYTMETEGPLAAMVSGFYLETIASRTQPNWLDAIERHIDKSATKGQRAHLQVDEVDEHADMVWNMIMRVIETPEDEQRFLHHMVKINALFQAYFVEITSMMMKGEADQVQVITAATRMNQKHQHIAEEHVG